MRSATAITEGLLLALFLAPLSAPPLRAGGGEPEARRAIDTAWLEHIEAAKRKDLAAVMRIYSDDVRYFVSGGQEAVGKRALELVESATLAKATVVDATHTIEALRVVGDRAYELGRVVGPVRSGDAEPRELTFHFMALWRREADGAWRIAHLVGAPE